MKKLTLFLFLILFAFALQGQKVITYQVLSDNYQVVYDAFTEKPIQSVNIQMDGMVRAIGTYWDSLDVFYLFANHTNNNNEALINWTNPCTFDATNVDATAYVAFEGFTGDGAADYINLNWNPTSDAINYTLNDASYGIYVRTNVNEDRWDAGIETGSNRVRIATRWSWEDKIYTYLHDATTQKTVNTDSRGLYIVSRNAAANYSIYKNAVQNTVTQGSTNIPDGNFYVLCENNDGVANAFSTKQISVAFTGKGISQIAVNTITDAVEGYMDSNSKGVISGTTTNIATPYKVITYDGKVIRQD